jgi:hypothetical protein
VQGGEVRSGPQLDPAAAEDGILRPERWTLPIRCYAREQIGNGGPVGQPLTGPFPEVVDDRDHVPIRASASARSAWSLRYVPPVEQHERRGSSARTVVGLISIPR